MVKEEKVKAYPKKSIPFEVSCIIALDGLKDSIGYDFEEKEIYIAGEGYNYFEDKITVRKKGYKAVSMNMLHFLFHFRKIEKGEQK